MEKEGFYFSANFTIMDLFSWICALQIVEKLVGIVTYVHQAISKFLGNYGMRSFHEFRNLKSFLLIVYWSCMC